MCAVHRTSPPLDSCSFVIPEIQKRRPQTFHASLAGRPHRRIGNRQVSKDLDPLLDEAGTAEVRTVITDTGAVVECEAMISRHVGEAVAALAAAPITGEARGALADLAVAATARDG